MWQEASIRIADCLDYGCALICNPMEIQDFAEQYRSETDDELLRLKLVADQLTPEANIALKEELARRSISGSDRLAIFRGEEAQRQTEQARDTGRLFSIYGTGRNRFGKTKYL